ncbi:multicopper oxidase family protein [Arthrobacter burdickii]|uniref:Multicopper oxidase domain-containing protein n=1 Tax=Arthrobacter burdickii TaxID=3035920 RepID=A0ABT8K2C8_9MICC|nr:multicopper oxidase domain-containing protein [Arthrobacter burdickii]MDN4611583.1 multicopper oxidase domain-containing protein [Arthrobacter burdickii]
MSTSRRQVLLLGGLGVLGAGAAVLPTRSVEAASASRLSSSEMPRPFQVPFVQAPFLAPYATGIDAADGLPVNYYKLTEKAATAQILPRLTTPILGYNGLFPGPTISLDQGTKAVLRIRNQLPATHPLDGHALSTSTHLHGSASLPQYDGYASDVTNPGFYKDYRYPNFQPARTLWYHDHGVHFTAQNAYSGLAAQYHMHDPIERQLLPQGRYDVALTVSDAMFAENGSLGYDDNTHSGLWGDVILVNGRPWPVMKVQKRVYRFRILNCSISRSLRPTLSTGAPLIMVGTDGGLMPAAQSVANYRHGGAERYEVLIDFRKYATGQRIELRNLSNKNNVDYDFTNKIMAFDVTDEPVDTTDPTWNRIPTTLVGSEAMSLKSAQAVKTRRFRVKRNDVTNMWTINDDSWQDVIASGYKKVIADPAHNSVEIWEIENSSGGWFHPVHIHLVDFQILSRNGAAAFAHERGPKDVVYVGEGETVRLLMKFTPQQGLYMMHCHNLPHEDHDMMAQFRVGLKESDYDPNDPMTAARAVWDDEKG